MSADQFKRNNFTKYTQDFIYHQYRDTDITKGSLYDINVINNKNPFTKNQAVLVIDSADRDHRKYPKSNKYKLDLKYTYKDVTLVELKFANIPNSSYIINESNNKLHFQDSMHQVLHREYNEIWIPIGNWMPDSKDEPSIRSNLEDALNAVNCDNLYQVLFDPHTRKFTIEQVKGSGIFNLIFCVSIQKIGQGGTITIPIQGVDRFLHPEKPVCDIERVYIEGSIGKVIGFLPQNLGGCTSYKSQNIIDLNTGRFVVLKIRNFDRINSNNSKIDGAFCVISMSDKVNNFVVDREFDYINHETYSKSFCPPLAELSKLEIEILDSHGNPYEFNGRDHLLVFDIVSLSRFDNC
jgi:hypothetical protein